jgi:hypothetical protein
MDCEEENVRRTCWQGHSEDVLGVEANRSTEVADDVSGVITRCTDMLTRYATFRCR